MLRVEGLRLACGMAGAGAGWEGAEEFADLYVWSSTDFCFWCRQRADLVSNCRSNPSPIFWVARSNGRHASFGHPCRHTPFHRTRRPAGETRSFECFCFGLALSAVGGFLVRHYHLSCCVVSGGILRRCETARNEFGLGLLQCSVIFCIIFNSTRNSHYIFIAETDSAEMICQTRPANLTSIRNPATATGESDGNSSAAGLAVERPRQRVSGGG